MRAKLFSTRWLVIVSLLFVARVVRAEVQPESAGAEGARAFRDLAVLYESGKTEPPFSKELDDLADGDAAKRESAGRYLLALFRQSFADESNGRAEWQRLPFWGGGSESPARDFHKKLAEAFGEKARGEAALDAVLWLSEHDELPEGPAAAAKVLPRIDSPRMEKVLADLVAQPHPNAALAVAAIEEAARRKLAALGPRIRELCGHYRDGVRAAARKTAPMLGIRDVPDFKPADAFSPWLIAQLDAIRRMVPVKVPATAEWFDFEHTDPRNTRNGKPWTEHYSGWLLTEKGDTSEVLTWFGDTASLPNAQTKRAARKLADVAHEIARLQSSREAARERLSPRGGLTAQFEPSAISTPAGLVAAWCFERSEREAAAAVLFPCLNAMQDDRWLTRILRDQLGHRCHQEMLGAFSNRDYARGIALADHLSQPVFDGYQYQDRAKILAAQLRARADDFKTFKLPTPEEWNTLRETLPRAEQAKYLAARLRLLNCFQWSQPGGVNYEDPQSADGGVAGRAKVINPFVELRTMKLTVAELPVLVPSLADENFLPTFSYWRDFHPARTLHQVNWLAAEIVNDVAKRDIAELKKYQSLDEAGRRRHLESVLAWCSANAAKSRTNLLLATLRETKEWREFSRAAAEAVREKLAGVATVLIERAAAFPDSQDDIAEMVYRAGDREAVGTARQWIRSTSEGVRFWAALALLRDGEKDEGFAELKALLTKDSGDNRYPLAIEPLIARKDEVSLALACGILKKKDFRGSFSAGEILHHLALTGRKEVLDFLTAALDDPADDGTYSGEWQGKRVERKQVRGDRVAGWIADWRSDGWTYEKVAPPKERAAKREELKRWLAEQFALLRAGKPAAFKAPPPLRVPRWQLDAP